MGFSRSAGKRSKREIGWFEGDTIMKAKNGEIERIER